MSGTSADASGPGSPDGHGSVGAPAIRGGQPGAVGPGSPGEGDSGRTAPAQAAAGHGDHGPALWVGGEPGGPGNAAGSRAARRRGPDGPAGAGSADVPGGPPGWGWTGYGGPGSPADAGDADAAGEPGPTRGPGGGTGPFVPGHGDHGPAVWVGGADGFRGCGFHIGGGMAVTAAHVVVGAEPPNGLTLGHPTGAHTVTGARATPAAPSAERTRFHPYPDLALLTAPGCAALPAARLAPADPPPGTSVTAVGYSAGTPSPGLQPDTLSLRVGGRSGAYLRVLGDGVREGFSGSMLVDDATGLVVGVLKGSRSYREVQGGWFTPVSALRAFLGPEAAATADVVADAAPPTDSDLVEALLAFPALARADNRHDLLDRMGDHLRLPYSFEVEERSGRRDHLFRLVLSCRHFRDERAALRSLYTAMEEIVPHDKALDRLRDLVGRAVGGWEDA